MERREYGPELFQKYTNNNFLLEFIDDCNSYVGKLSDFKKYCIWRYTIGSASVNSKLIFNKLSDNSNYWSYLFFLYYNNTFTSSKVPKPFDKWKVYFNDPKAFTKLTVPDQSIISNGLIDSYIKIMQEIILKAPNVKGSFHVFKVASKYPGLPDKAPGEVVQIPFNSTTVSPYFNFAPFISPTADSVLFDITMPKGSKCLFVPTDLHAYPFEHEIILPYGCTFKVNKISTKTLKYVNPDTVNVDVLQNKDHIQMGNVYDINEYQPCKSGSCSIRQKSFPVYTCDYLNP